MHSGRRLLRCCPIPKWRAHHLSHIPRVRVDRSSSLNGNAVKRAIALSLIIAIALTSHHSFPFTDAYAPLKSASPVAYKLDRTTSQDTAAYTPGFPWRYSSKNHKSAPMKAAVWCEFSR